MVKDKGMQFFIINMKMKRKRDKKIPAQNLNFERDQINQAHGS